MAGVKIGSVRTHPPEVVRDPAIERAVERTLSVPAGTPYAYMVDRVRLHEGGPPQTLVLLSGAYFCGSGGCSALILDGAPPYRVVTELTLMRPEWIVTKQTHRGWHDIVVCVSGGGATPHYARLRFDGRSYPANPSDAPAVAPGTVLSGDVVLVPDTKHPHGGYLWVGEPPPPH